MSDYGATNCTTEEREKLRIKLHSYCLEGGYCRKIPPNKLYCHCPPNYKNDICDMPAFLGAADLKMVVVIPLVILVVLVILGVVVFLLVRRHRRHLNEKKRQRREQSGNPLVNRQGNQEIYQPVSGGPAPVSGTGSSTGCLAAKPVWNCETGSNYYDNLA